LFDLFDRIHEHLVSSKSTTRSHTEGVKFAYPILYVGDAIGCETADDLLSKHPKAIAGLVNLWINDSQNLKEADVMAALKTDFHPFDYGVSCISGSCTIELHPANTRDIAKAEGISLEEHHFRERMFLAYLCEPAVAQFYALRIYDDDASELLARLQFKNHVVFNPILVVQLLFHAIKLTRFKRTLTQAVQQFRDSRARRKPYMNRAIQSYADAFGVQKVTESLNQKLQAIDGLIGTTFSMLTAVFTLFLTIAATCVAIIQLMQSE
jgi:hypothetical protein